MAEVTGFTAERMLAMENATVNDARLSGDNLILVTKDATEIDVGSVRGPVGPQGPVGEVEEAPVDDQAYVRMNGGWLLQQKDVDILAQSVLKTGNQTMAGELLLPVLRTEMGSAVGNDVIANRNFLGRGDMTIDGNSNFGQRPFNGIPVTRGVRVNNNGTMMSVAGDTDNVSSSVTSNFVMYCVASYVNDVDVGHRYMTFRHRDGGLSGRITKGSGTSVAYQSTSDYRLKDVVGPITEALSRVKDLKPIRFQWKDSPISEHDGFLAHEVDEVVPDAVTGEKDAVDKDGEIDPQGVDPAKIVPVLVAAIQELSAEVETLKARLA